MRKLTVESFVALDGVVESPMNWASPFFSDECRDYALRKLEDIEFFLLGRVAYQYFSAVWPQRSGPYMDRLKSMLGAQSSVW